MNFFGEFGWISDWLEDAGLRWIIPVFFLVMIVGLLVFLVVVFANISPPEPTPP